jgi:hypothetical protein
MFLSRLRILSIVCASLGAGVVALALSILLISPERIERRTWNRYYTLYIRDSENAEQGILRIAESGRFQAVVSRFTAEISFNTFAGFVSVPIHRLPDRLDPLDPRFDPYMQGVGKLFSISSGTSWEAAYLRSDRNVLSVYLDLRGLLGEPDLRWRLIEFEPVRAVIQVLLLILYLTVLIRMASNGSIRAAALLASLPWLPLVAISDFPVLLAFFVVMPAWVHLFEHLYFHRYIRLRVGMSGLIGDLARPVAVLAVSAGLAVLLKVPGPFVALLLAMAGGAAAAIFLYCFFMVRDSLHAHQPFRALPILRRLRPRRTRPSAEITLHLLLAFIVLFSYPLLRVGAAFLGPGPDTIRMHSIGDGRRAGLSWSSLAVLAEYSASGGIPNLADYLTHHAFQESLIFGRDYKFPTPGERIRISEYRVDPKRARVQKTFRVVKQFKESWLYATLEDAPPGSVARLLADQGFAGTLEMTPAAEPVVRYCISVVMIILFLLHFLVPRYFNLTASALYATRNLTLRRH